MKRYLEIGLTSHNAKALKTPLMISAIAHIVTIIILITAPNLGLSMFGERPMRIDAVWVDLPKGTSEEIGLGLKKAENLPRSTIEEQKQLFQPEKIRQETMEPKMTAPPPDDKTKKGEAVAERPKVDAKTTRKNDGKEEKKPPQLSTTDRKIRDALAKIDKQVKGRTIVPEASQIKDSAEGYKYGTGTEPLKVLPSDPEYLKYQAMVRAKIIREWIVPGKFIEEGSQHLNAKIEVMINTDGDVVTIRWESPSGTQTFDQSAVRAVKQASPFPKPPDRLAWEAYNEGFLIEFDPRLKPSY